MQFTAPTSALTEALNWVSKALPLRPSNPVLAGVKIDLADSALTISAFDYDQSAVARLDVDAAIGETGSIVVSGRLLTEIVRALPKNDTTFNVENTKVLMKSGNAKFTLATLPVEDYPTLPSDPTPLGTVAADEFAAAIRRTFPAAGRDDMLPVLTAVNVEVDADTGELRLAATDRFRLSTATIAFKADTAGGTDTFLVPARILDTWAKSLAAPAGERFAIGTDSGGGGVFSVDAGSKKATVRLIDGEYPKYRALIPTTFDTEVIFNVAALADAVKRVGLVADQRTPVALAFTADGIAISAAADDEASEHIDADVTGDDVTFGFNINYLLDGLAGIPAAEARASLGSPRKPAIFRAVGNEETGTYLLMPMRTPGS